jgi:uncharacterized membrane protein YfcA
MEFILSLFALSLINFVSTVFWACTGFGSAMVFHSLYFICKSISSALCPESVPKAVIYLTLNAMCLFPIQIYILRDSIQWDLVFPLLLLQPAGIYIGQNLLYNSNIVLLARTLGAFFFFFVLQMSNGVVKEILTSKLKVQDRYNIGDHGNSTNISLPPSQFWPMF